MPSKRTTARMESLHELMAFITGQARKSGFSGAGIDRVSLATEEALVNVVRYAYTTAGDVEVIVDGSDPERFTVEVRDWGAAFDPLSVAEPDVTADLDRRGVGGVGVLLIRRVAKEVRYRREHGCNVLTLTFSRSEGDGSTPGLGGRG